VPAIFAPWKLTHFNSTPRTSRHCCLLEVTLHTRVKVDRCNCLLCRSRNCYQNALLKIPYYINLHIHRNENFKSHYKIQKNVLENQLYASCFVSSVHKNRRTDEWHGCCASSKWTPMPLLTNLLTKQTNK